MTFSVAVAGCTGYAGGELLRLLLAHPEVEIGALTAHASAGDRLGQHLPNLGALADRTVQPTSAETLAGHDVVFLALPHGASGPIAGELGEQVLVLDAGADHRLESADDWQQHYHSEHAGTWPYGLPELPGQRELLSSTRRVAVPGCFPTTSLLGLWPGITSGLIGGQDITITAPTGTSGAGKSPKTHLLGSELFGSVSAYGLAGTHRHTPEIVQGLAHLGVQKPSLTFTPVLAPMSRGILAVITAPLVAPTTTQEAREIYREVTADEPFVQVLADDQWPQSKSIVGSNMVQLQVAVDASVNRLLVVATLDNLTKGTAGGAIQSMNLALGLPETTGLPTNGVAP